MAENSTDKYEAVTRGCYGVFFALMLSTTSLSSAIAGPEGGQVAGGAGSIVSSGNTTTINQSTQNMAIDWQSYNVNTNERVQYIQPNSSSISLNRILSQNGSTIAGRIDANGQVILVNPNGIYFTPTSIINVGGIIASGLNIQPNDFMNGNYIFDEVLDTDGTVINSGMINASLGGNVALIGKQVENDGLIVANLGTVNLAAGKQAVLTFDQGGLLGVRISKEILQEELGVDPAVLNSGEINAEGGRVLLTASTSQDVFSQAVNTGDLNQPTSVVVHEDGSFTLGGGADVINIGTVDVSTTSNDQNTGCIVLIGENVTSNGELLANAANGNGGEIELHSQNTTLLTENSVTSARSEANGQGGNVKVLGDNVGLLDQSVVDASGANSGGEILIGGDQEGNNALIPNAEFIYLSDESQVFADALDNGDGGRLITFASDTARIYGNLFARGGINGGNGGFIETSGLRGFELTGVPDASAVSGRGGVWLIDPYSITINNNATQNAPDVDRVFTSTGTPAEINVTAIRNALDDGSNVIVRTGSGGSEAGDIIFDAGLDYNNRENGTLTLDALGDIRFMDGSEILDSEPGNNNLQDALTLNLYARGDVVIGSNVSITTQGGNFVVGDPGNSTPIIPTSFTNNGTINTTGAQNRNGGNVAITTSGALITTELTANGGMADIGTAGQAAGSITLSSDSIILNGDLSSVGSVGNENNTDGNGATITLDGPVILANTVTLDARGDTSGDISFHNTLNGTAAHTDNLTLYGNGMIFSGSVGDSTRLGSLMINATGNVNAGTITATSLDVQNSTRFISGSIDTSGASDSSGGAVMITAGTEITLADIDASAGARTSASGGGNGYGGGSVTLTGADITVNQVTTAGSMAFNSAMTSRDGGAGGTIQINGIEDTNNPPSIILNGDINASGGTGINDGTDGTSQTATLSLTSTTTATTTINYQNDFTSDIILTGSDGTDTLTGPDTNNTWTVTGNNEGGLNNRLTFRQMENLTGGTGTDGFTFTNTGAISGMIDGGGGNGTNTLAGRNTDTIWSITPAGTANSLTDTSGTVYVADVTRINTLIGGSAIDTFNITTVFTGDINGGDNNDIFTLEANVSGTVNGNVGNDTFNIQADGLTVTLVGGTSETDTDTVTANDSANPNDWNVNDAGGGTLNSTITFSQIETLTGGTGTDNFLISNSGTIAQINGGGGTGTNTLTGRNTANEWNVNASNAGTLYIDNNPNGFGSVYVNEFTNIQNLTGGTGADRFVMGLTGSISGTVDGGSTSTSTSSNTLVSRQGVTNIWDFATDESGMLTQSGESTPYVNIFTNIQNYVGGGGSNEWADFSSASGSVDINAESYFGFTGIIGNGANSTLNGQDGQTNAWVINNVAATLPTNTTGEMNGINDGTFDNPNVTTATPLVFVDFANLVGGNRNDTFTIVGTSSVASINGGGVGTDSTDSIQGPAGTEPVTWTLNSAGGAGSTISYGISSLINFTNIQTLNGAADTSDTFNFTAMPENTDVTTINGGSNVDTSTTDTVSVASIIDGATLNVGTYQQIETYIGNANSTLEGGVSSDWTIEDIAGATPGINDGKINGTTNFYDFGTVLGGSGTDTFTFIGSATIASINGAGDANQITGPDGTNTLTLATATATTTFEINGTSTIINNIQTLNGGTGADTFVINTTSAASGVQTLNGGAGHDIFEFFNALSETAGMSVDGQAGIDTLDLSAQRGPISVALNQYDAERIIGNDTSSTFTGIAGLNTWIITPVASSAGSTSVTYGQNDGTISNGTDSQTFIGFNNLTGGNGDDNFTIEAGGNLTGLLTGGGGNRNTLTILNTSIVNVERESGTAGTSTNLNVTNLSAITGNGETTLVSDSAVENDWVITDVNAGTLGSMTFSNFSTLQGGTNSDTFTLHDSIDFAGSIDGGSIGTDEIIAGNRPVNNWEITGTNNTGTVTGLTGNFSDIETLTGNNQTDHFRLSNTANFAGSINGADGTDQLTGGDSVNTWTITGTDAGNVTNLSNGFSDIETLVGGNQQDTFTLSDTVTFGGTVSGGTQTNDQTDRLIAGDRENEWAITGANNTGTVTGLTGLFTDIEFLDGNNRRDMLTLSDAHTFNGSFNGAGGSMDEVIGANVTTNWTITGMNNTGTVTGLSGTFSQVETLTGTAAQDTFTLWADADFVGNIDGGAGSLNDRLVGGATSNSWVIDGKNGNTVTGLAAGNTFTNIQNLSGAAGAFDDTFTFRNGGSIAGHIDGGGQLTQDVVDMSALNSAITVRLGVGQDINNIERVIGNNDGKNTDTSSFGSTFVAEDNTNLWTITDFEPGIAVDGINDGTVDGVQFINFNNLQGGTAADTFVVTASGDITGLIDGGSPNRAPWVPGQTTPAAVTEGTLQTEDILDYSALSAVDITIDTDFANIELVKGNSNGSAPDDSTLRTGAIGDNNWLILGFGTGVVNSTQFVDFNHIVGGDSNDTFVVEGDFGGSIRGGDGSGTDTVNYQALDTYRVVFGGALGIAEIERVEGGGSGFTIAGQAGSDNAWTISGANQGDVTANGETLAFIGFDNIEGNNESAYGDTFTVQGGSIDGTVSGMAGDDTLIVELTGVETGQISFDGGEGANTVLVQNGTATATIAYNGQYTAGISDSSGKLQYTNVIAGTPRVFTLDYQQTGLLQDTLSADSLTINGTENTDTIELGFDSELGMNTFMVNGASTAMLYSNKNDLTVLGLGGTNDIVNITADPSLTIGTGVLTIDAEIFTSTSTVTANQLILDSVVEAGNSSAPIKIDVTDLSLLDTAGELSQALYLQEQNGLTVSQLGEVELVDIEVLAGDFTNSTPLITNSQLNVSANGAMGGNIVLTGDNQFSGAVTLNAANDIVFDGDNEVSAGISLNATTINLSGNNQITAPITLAGTTAIINNTVETDLGNVTVESLTVTSTESISDSGVINVQAAGMGIADLTSINGSIVLDNENNNFAEVRLNALNGAAIINESDGITITHTVVGDALTVTSNIGLAANDTAIDDMGLGSMTAVTINLNANEGAIINQSSNLTADAITLTAAAGIGENKTVDDRIDEIDSTDSIRTTTSTLSVINLSAEGTTATSGVINISNTGNVTINDLRNYGDIRLENAGNITLNITDSSGAIDAHYGGSISDPSYEGSVAIHGAGNNTFSTLGKGTLSGNADIIAENLSVRNVTQFGTQASPIGLRVNQNFTLLARRGVVYYLGNEPKDVTTTGDLLQLAIRGFVGVSGQQLINIETLGEIDPAIFTEVRNYNHDDVAIRLPAEQRYDDNDEDETENNEEESGSE